MLYRVSLAVGAMLLAVLPLASMAGFTGEAMLLPPLH